MYFSARCKTCRCQYKTEIHKLVLEEGWTNKQVERWLKERNERISDTAIGKHFRNHVYPYLDSMKQADKYTSEYLKKRLDEDVSALERIKDKLSILEIALGSIVENKQNMFKPSMIRELRGLSTDIVKCMSEYEKIKKEYYPDTEVKKENVYKDFIEACEGIPAEYLNLIAERLKNRGY